MFVSYVSWYSRWCDSISTRNQSQPSQSSHLLHLLMLSCLLLDCPMHTLYSLHDTSDGQRITSIGWSIDKRSFRDSFAFGQIDRGDRNQTESLPIGGFDGFWKTYWNGGNSRLREINQLRIGNIWSWVSTLYRVESKLVHSAAGSIADISFVFLLFFLFSWRPSTTVSEEKSGIILSKGSNAFEFSFILPSTSASSEDSIYGRVLWMLTATTFGSGRANSNISIERPIFPITNLRPEGGSEGGCFALSTNHESPIGLLRINFYSATLCVGGSLSIDINSQSPKTNVKVYWIKVSIESIIQTESKQGVVRHSRLGTLLSKGFVPPGNEKIAEQGDSKDGIVYDDSTRESHSGKKEWSIGGTVRLPNDKVIRGTTHPNSSTSIRWSHNFLVQIVYSFSSDPSELKVFSTRNKIQLPSCCAAHANRLPKYQPDRDSSTPLPGKESVPPLLPNSPWVSFDDPIQILIRLYGSRADCSSWSLSLLSLFSSTTSSQLDSTAKSVFEPTHINCICGQPLLKSPIPECANSPSWVDGMTPRKP